MGSREEQEALQISAREPIDRPQPRLGVAYGRSDLVEVGDRMAGRLVLRQVAADAATGAEASQVHRLHRRRQPHGCGQTLASNEMSSQLLEPSR